MKELIFFVCLLISFTLYSQEKRLALVIGNSAYEYGGELPNPINDAFAMKRSLTEVGFDVQEYYNLSQGDLKKAIDEFGLKLKNYDVGLFFYAGHGIQANGRNYLIPVDADLLSELQAEYDCVLADRVLSHMDASGADVNIVILDACRNNPFERSWKRSVAGNGLAVMNAPTGTLIAYATAPGSTASDGSGMNSPYTEAILESMQIPNITVLKMFQNVRGLVNERSNSQQTPWESTSLTGDFYFLRNTENNAPQIQSSPSTSNSISRGASSTVIDGYILTHQKYGRNRGVYLGEELLSKREFALLLKEAELDLWLKMDKSWLNYYIGWYGIGAGTAFLLGYGLAAEFSKDEEKIKKYNVWSLMGAGTAGAGAFVLWLGYKQYTTVLKYYFPDNFSNLQFGPTQNGFGLALNF